MQLHGAHKAHKGICGMDESVFIRKIHQNKCECLPIRLLVERFENANDTY